MSSETSTTKRSSQRPKTASSAKGLESVGRYGHSFDSIVEAHIHLTRINLQIFRTIFSHLTTSIMAIGEYLHRNEIPRGQASDVTMFKALAERHHATLSERATTAYKKVEEGRVATMAPKAQAFLTAVGWSADQFLLAYAACFGIMGEPRITAKERLSKALAARLLAISGLSWAPESKNRGRDWERFASAASAETALVELYRKKLLLECAPARALRKDLHDLFLSWATHQAQIPTDGGSGLTIAQRWEFADKIYIQASDVEEQRQDFTKTRMAWEVATGTSKASKQKAKKVPKDSIEAMLEGLKSNKYLQCSDQEEGSVGTLESLSAFAISILGHVGS